MVLIAEIPDAPSSEDQLFLVDGSVWITGVKLRVSEYKIPVTGGQLPLFPLLLQQTFREVADVSMLSWEEKVLIRHTDALDPEKLTEYVAGAAQSASIPCEYIGTTDSPLEE
mmetsp:Transcript_4798/g.9551  ORF Transcript_4798/g.9551 Transcript_4798/m.9551 type:complete len:112 (+) Transcript_4798:47-382(+)